MSLDSFIISQWNFRFHGAERNGHGAERLRQKATSYTIHNILNTHYYKPKRI